MNSKFKNRLIMVLVFLVFCAPFVISWWFLEYTNVVEEGSKSNSGELILPPILLPNLDLVDPLTESRKGNLHGKWSFVYIVENQCDQWCKENLYRMRQIRLTAGKDDHRVQRVLLMIEGNQEPAQTFMDYAGQWVFMPDNQEMNLLLEKFRLSPADQPEKLHRLYLVDPLGNLMMHYSEHANPGGIIKDLKKLLKLSKIG